MVVCHYFQQGNCRFGNACRNEHVYDNRYTFVNSNSNTTNYRSQVQPQSNSNNEIAMIVKSVTQDMVAAEKGNQWLLSCYGPIKDKPNFPGLEDQSFEEVRLGMYEAQKMGTVDQYAREFTHSKQMMKLKFQSYQTATNELITIIKNLYSSEVAKTTFDTHSASHSVFQTANPVSNSIFNTAASKPPSNNVFNTNQTSTSIFGGSTPSVFNQQQSSNLFSTSNPTNSSSSIFAKPAAQSMSIFGAPVVSTSFNAPPQNTNIFGGGSSVATNYESTQQFGAAPTASASIFATPTASGSIFATPQPATNVFASQQSEANTMLMDNQPTSAFATSPVESRGSLFGSGESGNIFAAASKSIFGTNPDPTPNIFNTQGSANIFAQNTNQVSANIFKSAPTTSIFGNSQPICGVSSGVESSSMFTEAPPNIFGNPTGSQFDSAPPNANPFGKNPMIGNQTSVLELATPPTNSPLLAVNNSMSFAHFYSKLDELTQVDVAAFNSDGFEFNAIPELPPTQEMCH